MAKRMRNNIGQFIPKNLMEKEPILFPKNFWKRTIQYFVVLFFLFMASPWLAIAVKSKILKLWIYSIFKFYNTHFIGEDEINQANKCPTPQKDL